MDEEGHAKPTKCLFCDKIDDSIEKSIEHLQQQHHISLNAVKKKFNLDQYSWIKVSFVGFFADFERFKKFSPIFR